MEADYDRMIPYWDLCTKKFFLGQKIVKWAIFEQIDSFHIIQDSEELKCNDVPNFDSNMKNTILGGLSNTPLLRGPVLFVLGSRNELQSIKIFN